MKGKVLDESASRRIKEAARSIFLDKGYDGTTMQAIADLSQVNKALLHYYYLGKNNLFLLIFEEEFQRILEIGRDTLLDPKLPLIDKLEHWVDREFAYLSRIPLLPLFLINEFNRNPGLIVNLLQRLHLPDTTRLLKRHNKELVESGRGIRMEELFTMIISMLFFPFMGAPVVQFMWDLSPDRWLEVQAKQVGFIKEVIKKYLG
jgi:AcrR family transcriptional regulator